MGNWNRDGGLLSACKRWGLRADLEACREKAQDAELTKSQAGWEGGGPPFVGSGSMTEDGVGVLQILKPAEKKQKFLYAGNMAAAKDGKRAAAR